MRAVQVLLPLPFPYETETGWDEPARLQIRGYIRALLERESEQPTTTKKEG